MSMWMMVCHCPGLDRLVTDLRVDCDLSGWDSETSQGFASEMKRILPTEQVGVRAGKKK